MARELINARIVILLVDGGDLRPAGQLHAIVGPFKTYVVTQSAELPAIKYRETVVKD